MSLVAFEIGGHYKGTQCHFRRTPRSPSSSEPWHFPNYPMDRLPNFHHTTQELKIRSGASQKSPRRRLARLHWYQNWETSRWRITQQHDCSLRMAVYPTALCEHSFTWQRQSGQSEIKSPENARPLYESRQGQIQSWLQWASKPFSA